MVFTIVVVVSLFGGVYAVWSRKLGHTRKTGVSGGLTEKSSIEGERAMGLSFFPRGYPEGVGLYMIRGVRVILTLARLMTTVATKLFPLLVEMLDCGRISAAGSESFADPVNRRV